MGKHLSINEKQLIIQMRMRGFGNRLISQQLNCRIKTISTVISDWRKGKVVGRKVRTGVTKLSAQKIFQVLNYFIENPFNTYAQCIKDLKLNVSCCTVEKVLKGNGIKNYVASSKPFLSIKNQIKRLRFSMTYRDWNLEWANVTYIDEKTIQTFANGRVLVKRKKNERYNHNKLVQQEKKNTDNKVNLVGMIHYNGPNMV